MILPKKDVSYVAVYMIKFTGFNKFDQVNLAVENSFLTVKWKKKMGRIIFPLLTACSTYLRGCGIFMLWKSEIVFVKIFYDFKRNHQVFQSNCIYARIWCNIEALITAENWIAYHKKRKDTEIYDIQCIFSAQLSSVEIFVLIKFTKIRERNTSSFIYWLYCY